MTNWTDLLASLALGAAAASLFWYVAWDKAKYRADDIERQLDAAYAEGWDDAVADRPAQPSRPGDAPAPGREAPLTDEDQETVEWLERLHDDPPECGQPTILGGWERPCQLPVDHDGPHLRKPESCDDPRLRVVSLGDLGDDKMMARDWFARREWVASLRDEWGGFEITDSGHLVAVA